MEIVISQAEYRGGRTTLEDAIEGPGLRVVRVWSPVRTPDTAIKKFIVMAAFLIGASMRTAIGRRAFANVFYTTPPLFAWLGLWLQALGRGACCYMVMDIYPDVLIASEALSARTVTAKFLGSLSRQIFRRAAAVVVIGRDMEEHVIAAGAVPERTHLIRNWPHAATLRPVASSNQLRASLGFEDELVVLYSGNMGISHTFTEVVEAAKRLMRRTDIQFVFVGEGVRLPQIRKECAGLPNVHFLPFQPAERLAATLHAGDVSLITLRPRFEGIVVPSKSYGPMAVGRCLLFIGPEQSEIARMIAEHGVGVVVPPGDIDGLRRRLEDLAANRSAVTDMGERAARLVQKELGREHAAASWITMLQQLGRQNPSDLAR